ALHGRNASFDMELGEKRRGSLREGGKARQENGRLNESRRNADNRHGLSAHCRCRIATTFQSRPLPSKRHPSRDLPHMSSGVGSQLKYPALRDLSAAAQAAAAWFRAFARALSSCRLYEPTNPVVIQIRQHLREQLNGSIVAHGAWRFRITPNEIW